MWRTLASFSQIYYLSEMPVSSHWLLLTNQRIVCVCSHVARCYKFSIYNFISIFWVNVWTVITLLYRLSVMDSVNVTCLIWFIFYLNLICDFEFVKRKIVMNYHNLVYVSFHPFRLSESVHKNQIVERDWYHVKIFHKSLFICK